mmetsp:Transcript_19065/g.22479  ORF Transcript_19065/g.22479 Transcript_19065/m.22479 type:complete len:152 (-) Transcript_19065:215-670(-)
MTNDDLMDSNPHFGLYRPEIREAPGPLTYKEAKRKYRMNADPHMGEYAKAMRKYNLGVSRQASNQRGRSVNQELTGYLGKTYGGTNSGSNMRNHARFRSNHNVSNTQQKTYHVQTPDMMYENRQHGSSMSPLTKSIDMRQMRNDSGQFPQI